MPDLNGFLLIDKPCLRTSASVVRELSRMLGGVKCGHLGTLDPMATGLLVVCVGNAVKLVPYLQKGSKKYLAEISFGRSTDTYDAEGKTVKEGEVPEDLHKRVLRSLTRFDGVVKQLPPSFSAVKVNGKRLHKLARQGKPVSRPEREVTFYGITVISKRADAVVLEVNCSAGTYIRSLAHDLGKAVGCPAHLSALRRASSAPFSLDRCIDFESLHLGRTDPAEHIIPVEEFLPPLPRRLMSASEEKMVRNGMCLQLDGAAPTTVLLMSEAGRLVALGQGDAERETIRIRRVIDT
jgi:tRNA pseudouridine55 synthase